MKTKSISDILEELNKGIDSKKKLKNTTRLMMKQVRNTK